MTHLTNNDIEEIYNKHVKPLHTNEYMNKYHPFENHIHKNNKNWKWENKDFPRVISLLEFGDIITKYNFSIDKLLTFNGSEDPELEYLCNRYKQLLNIDYDNTANHDLHTLKLKHNGFDFVLLNQTLEHLYNPFACLENINKHMCMNGYLYINAPACNVPHSDPYHFYTGFSLTGLLCIGKLSGFKILEAGQWGNTDYLVKLWTRNPGWSDYQQINNPGKNELQNPVIVWCLLQKEQEIIK